MTACQIFNVSLAVKFWGHGSTYKTRVLFKNQFSTNYIFDRAFIVCHKSGIILEKLDLVIFLKTCVTVSEIQIKKRLSFWPKTYSKLVHNKFSTFMTLPGPASQECTGPCHENVPSLWLTDGRIVLAQDRDSCHLGTLSTILQHFTHKMKPTAARQCHYALWDISPQSMTNAPKHWPS